MDNRDSGSAVPSFIAGAVIGGAVGAAVALLFAPRTGEETRKILKEKAGEVGKDLEKFKKQMGPKFEEMKKHLAKK